MANEVIFAPEARNDLRQIFIYVAGEAGPATASGYVERIQDYCAGFVLFPRRGRQRNDLRPGLRTIGFERRVTIAFHIRALGTVVIDRVLYGGRDLAAIFGDD